MYIDESNAGEALEDILVGHRIVKAEETVRGYHDVGVLTLDNGVEIEVLANEGCGGCSNGWYEISGLGTCDNVITAVRSDQVCTAGGGWDDEAYRYEIFVVADNKEINVVTVEGSDGNGYYGTGYTIQVKAPSKED